MKIAVIGAGAMGGAVASGLLNYAKDKYSLTVSNPSARPLEILSAEGATVTNNNVEAARDAEIVIVAVKPWIVETVLTEIKDSLDYSRQTVVVIAAGLTGLQIMEWL